MTVYKVVLFVEPVSEEATAEDVEEFVQDLTWVGGCRDPDNDPMFGSVEILQSTVTKSRRPKKGKSE